jgi:hypothetical protein
MRFSLRVRFVFIADLQAVALHLVNGALHDGAQSQFLNRWVQEPGVEIDYEVMTPPVPANVDHTTLLESLDDGPDLPFCMPYGIGNLFHGAIRAKGDVKQNMSLGRQEGPVNDRWLHGVRLADTPISSVRH